MLTSGCPRNGDKLDDSVSNSETIFGNASNRGGHSPIQFLFGVLAMSTGITTMGPRGALVPSLFVLFSVISMSWL